MGWTAAGGAFGGLNQSIQNNAMDFLKIYMSEEARKRKEAQQGKWAGESTGLIGELNQGEQEAMAKYSDNPEAQNVAGQLLGGGEETKENAIQQMQDTTGATRTQAEESVDQTKNEAKKLANAQLKLGGQGAFPSQDVVQDATQGMPQEAPIQAQPLAPQPTGTAPVSGQSPSAEQAPVGAETPDIDDLPPQQKRQVIKETKKKVFKGTSKEINDAAGKVIHETLTAKPMPPKDVSHFRRMIPKFDEQISRMVIKGASPTQVSELRSVRNRLLQKVANATSDPTEKRKLETAMKIYELNDEMLKTKLKLGPEWAKVKQQGKSQKAKDQLEGLKVAIGAQKNVLADKAKLVNQAESFYNRLTTKNPPSQDELKELHKSHPQLVNVTTDEGMLWDDTNYELNTDAIQQYKNAYDLEADAMKEFAKGAASWYGMTDEQKKEFSRNVTDFVVTSGQVDEKEEAKVGGTEGNVAQSPTAMPWLSNYQSMAQDAVDRDYVGK